MFIYRLFIVATDVRVRVPVCCVYHTHLLLLPRPSGTSDVHFLHFAHTHTLTLTHQQCARHFEKLTRKIEFYWDGGGCHILLPLPLPSLWTSITIEAKLASAASVEFESMFEGNPQIGCWLVGGRGGW